jgi:heat shock protein HslJ
VGVWLIRVRARSFTSFYCSREPRFAKTTRYDHPIGDSGDRVDGSGGFARTLPPLEIYAPFMYRQIRNLAIAVLVLLVIGLAPEPARAQTVNEGDIGWSATNPMLSKEAGHTTVHPDPNPLLGTWAVEEVRFNGAVVPAPTASKGRRAGMTIWQSDWADFYGFDGCREIEGKFNLFSGTLVVEGGWRPTEEACESLRYPGVIRRALASSPKPVVTKDAWIISVAGMEVRFVRADPATVQLGSTAFMFSLFKRAWLVTDARIGERVLTLSDPMLWRGSTITDRCSTYGQYAVNPAGGVEWAGPNTVRFRGFEPSSPAPTAGKLFLPTLGCTPAANDQSAALRTALQSGYQLHRDGDTLVISNDAATLQLAAIDYERTGSAFRTAPDARGYWRFLSMTVDGKSVAGPGRLEVTIPTELPVEVGYLSDGCNTFRGQYLQLDGQLFGAIQPLTTLPSCPAAGTFTSTYQALVTDSRIQRDGNRVSLRNDHASITFAFVPFPAPPIRAEIAKSTTLQGHWTIRSLAVAGVPLPTSFRGKDAGLVDIEFRPGKTWAGSDGCNSTGGTYAVVHAELRLVEKFTTLAACLGSESDGPAVALRSAIHGKITITKDELTFRRGDIVATMRR